MHIHILGICGTFMGGLAALAREAGHRVTGCDAGVYPPMSDQLRALRELAVVWMARMADFRPHLSGAVWRGTATRLSDIYIQLFCEDSKSAEIFLIDHQVRYVPRTVTGFHGETVDALSVHAFCPGLGEEVGVHLLIYDRDDIRGAPKADAKGRATRGDLAATRALLHDWPHDAA